VQSLLVQKIQERKTGETLIGTFSIIVARVGATSLNFYLFQKMFLEICFPKITIYRARIFYCGKI